jgi:RNA-directed DNA polymerase
VSWILDMDLKGFFDNIDKEHRMEMVERRIADTRVLRLIRKWLNAGVIEEGEWSRRRRVLRGTLWVRSVIAALLANIYRHYVLGQWTDQWRESAQGDVIIVRYADDAVIGFQHEYEAKKFLKDLGLCGWQRVTAVPTATDVSHGRK